MLEVILVYFLAKRIGNIAEQKGLRARSWIWRTVLVWIATEILGVVVGMLLWGKDNFFMVELTALGFAIGGYFTLRENLLKKDSHPDDFDFDKKDD